MIELDPKFSRHIISYRKTASREYNFTLKNLPGEPWNLTIRAVKKAGDKRYRGLCSLKVRRINDKDFYHPSMKSEDPDQAIYLTLTMFLIGEIAEVEKDKSFD